MGFEIFGYIATFFSAISAIPQAIKVIRTRDITGISFTTWLIGFLATISWFSYGIYLSDIPLIVTNIMTSSSQLIILYVIFKESPVTS